MLGLDRGQKARWADLAPCLRAWSWWSVGGPSLHLRPPGHRPRGHLLRSAPMSHQHLCF